MNPLRSGLAAICGLMIALPLPAAELTTANALKYFKITPEMETRLLAGEILTRDADELTPDQLSVALTLYVPVPPAKLGDDLRSDWLQVRAARLARGPLPGPGGPPVTAAAFDKLPLGDDEVDSLLDARAGHRFNLSADEIASLQAAAKAARGPGSARAAVARAYKEILAARANLYFAKGLDGIAPYAREDRGKAVPAKGLRVNTEKFPPLAKFFPEARAALLKFPGGPAPNSRSQFLWESDRVEDRPDVVLIHRLSIDRPDATLLAVRQFYVGHSYDSSQIVAGAVPFHGGSLVFYFNWTFTDQVTGALSELKHSIGRSRMRDQILADFQRLRANFAR